MDEQPPGDLPLGDRPVSEPAPDKKPLRDRVVLVLGAGDLATRTLALHASARGASLVCAGGVLGPVLETAGFAAATRGTARVIESAAPPLLGSALLRAAAAVLAPATDAFVAEAAFPSATEARAGADELAADLGRGAKVVVVPVRPDGGSKAYAVRTIDEWLATLLPTAKPSSSDPRSSDPRSAGPR